MDRTYKSSDVINERFLRLPLSLFANPNYRTLSAESKLVYSLLLDRMSLSQRNGWINEEGEVYLIYTREEIADILCITYKKAIAAFKELINAGLLLEKRQGRGFPNRLFILKCELENSDAEDFGDEFDSPKSAESDEKEPANPYCEQICQNGSSRYSDSAHQELPKQHIKTCLNSTSRTSDSAVQDMPKTQTIQTYNNYINNIQSDNSQSVDRELEEILTNCRFGDFEEKTAQMLESAVRVIYYKQNIKLSGALLPQSEIRNLLKRVNRDTLIDVLEIMRKNESEIRNPTGYLYSLILNSVNAEQAETILELPDEMIEREMLYASD